MDATAADDTSVFGTGGGVDVANVADLFARHSGALSFGAGDFGGDRHCWGGA